MRSTGVVAGVAAGVMMCLVVVIVTVTATTIRPQGRHSIRQFPCPDPVDIAPCECIFDDIAINLTLLCSDLTSIEELDTVFGAYIPFDKFDLFQLQDSNISVIPVGIFRSIYFTRMFLIKNNLTTIEEGALMNQYDTLKQFNVLELTGSGYNWPLMDMASFKVLDEIGITGPHDSMAPLTSITLSKAVLDMHQLENLPIDAFTNAPNLTLIAIRETMLQDLQPNMFLSLPLLQRVILSYNILPTLVGCSMAFTSTNLTEIDLSHNNISNIQPGAFEGVSGPVEIKLNNNQLQELNEDPFSILVANITKEIDVTDNPLKCSCDLHWIVNTPDEQLHKLVGLLPACGIPDDTYGLDTLKDFISYQCSS